MSSSSNDGSGCDGVDIPVTSGGLAMWLTLTGLGASIAVYYVYQNLWRHRRPITDELHGTTVIVTGANCGIGFATAERMASMGARVVLGCRNPERCAIAASQIRTTTGNADVVVGPPLDLGVLGTVDEFAAWVNRKELKPRILINNAGAMVPDLETKLLTNEKGTTHAVEATFAANTVGPAALTMSLLPALKAAATETHCARVINVSSRLEKFATLDSYLHDVSGKSLAGLVDPKHTGKEASSARAYAPFTAYANAKQGNLLFTYKLADTLCTDEPSRARVLVAAVSPGMVNTSLGRWHPWFPVTAPLRWLLLPSPSAGAEASVFAATSPTLEEVAGTRTPLYFGVDRNNKRAGVTRIESSPASHDVQLQQRLWKKLSQIIGWESTENAD
eukprot:m.177623 g.177623  ORF g.177623 m.177623 type:complete len:390 (+) comp18374_c0_seq5:335-1504(+)